MGGGIGDFFSGVGDVLGDIGGGISDAVSSVGSAIGDAGQWVGNELGNAWQGINDLGLDNILATAGTLIPGPWTPAAIAYNVGDSALSGNPVGALTSAISGFGGMGGGGELPGLSSLFDSGTALADLSSTMQTAAPIAETTGDWFKPITQSFGSGEDLISNARDSLRSALNWSPAQQSSGGGGLLSSLGLGGMQGEGMTPFSPSSPFAQFTGQNTANTGSTWGLGNLFEGIGGIGGLTKLASPILKGVGGILGAQEASQNRSQLQDMMNQMQNRNQFYQNQLQQTYQNPQAYLASPEAQALRSATGQAIAREDARTGRRGQYVAAMNQLNQNMLGNLNKYRQGLAGQVSPQYDASQLALQRALMSQSPTGNVMAGLGSIFGK